MVSYLSLNIEFSLGVEVMDREDEAYFVMMAFNVEQVAHLLGHEELGGLVINNELKEDRRDLRAATDCSI